MADVLLCAVILFFGGIILFFPIYGFRKICGVETSYRPFLAISVLGAFTLAAQRNQAFHATSAIGKFLNFRTPLSKLLLHIANMIVGKIAGVSSDTALIDYFFTPYSVIDKTQGNFFIALGLTLLMTVVSSLELYAIFVIFFPEIYIVVPIIIKKIVEKTSTGIGIVPSYELGLDDTDEEDEFMKSERERQDQYLFDRDLDEMEDHQREAEEEQLRQQEEERSIIEEEERAAYEEEIWHAYNDNNNEKY